MEDSRVAEGRLRSGQTNNLLIGHLRKGLQRTRISFHRKEIETEQIVELELR
jgi:hypothetical protein